MGDEEKNERERLMNMLKDKTEIHDVGSKYVSRWSAKRGPYCLTNKLLKKLDRAAVKGRKHGTPGIFYPIEDVRVLSNEKNWVPPSHISEVRITKQLKPDTYDLDELRQYGVLGNKKGKKGRPAYFYSQETIVREVGIDIIPTNWEEGKHYIQMTRYPDKQDDFPTRFAIHQSGPLRPGALYYWGKEATSSVRMNDEPTRPKRIRTKEAMPDDDESDEEEDEDDDDARKRDLEMEIEEIKREIHDLQNLLAKKEYRLKMWGKEMIYSSSDTD